MMNQLARDDSLDDSVVFRRSLASFLRDVSFERVYDAIGDSALKFHGSNSNYSKLRLFFIFGICR